MIHHVFANRSNSGDWLSAKGIQRLLEPAEVSEHLCDGPFVDETLAALERLPQEDVIVIGGGGLFMDYFDPFWRGFESVARNKTFVIWGAGSCDLKREETTRSRSLWRRIAGMSRLSVVRDAATAELLGVETQPVVCPSVTMVEPVTSQGDGILHAANLTTAGADVYEVMRSEARRFATDTGRRFRETNNRIEAGREDELRQNLSLYERSDRVLSSRLHGCIIALAAGRPVVAVSGDQKIDSFMTAAGLAEWVLGQDETALIRDLLDAGASQPRPQRFLDEALRANEAVADAVADIAAEMSGAAG